MPFARRIIQNPTFNRIATHILPFAVRHKIGQWLRKLSKRHTKRQRPITMDVINDSVTQQFQQSGASTIIHGHTHRPMIETTYLDQRPCTRYVLASWHENGNALIVGEDRVNRFLTIA